MHVHADQLALADEKCYTELSMIDLEKYSESLENGRDIFTGRGTYVLLSVDSKFSILQCFERERERDVQSLERDRREKE